MLQTPQKLGSPEFVKLDADATYKDIVGVCCVIPVGVLSQAYGQTTAANGVPVNARRGHFTPVLLVVATSKAAPIYRQGFEAVAQLPLSGCELGAFVRQVHADAAERFSAFDTSGGLLFICGRQ